MQTLHPRFGPWILGRQKTQNTNFASKVWALDFRQAEDPECKLCIQGLGLEFFGRQKTQNANFASKVWALSFRQAEGPECKLFLQGLGLEFKAGRRPRMQTLHPRFGPWNLGRQKTQNANFTSKV